MPFHKLHRLYAQQTEQQKAAQETRLPLAHEDQKRSSYHHTQEIEGKGALRAVTKDVQSSLCNSPLSVDGKSLIVCVRAARSGVENI